MNNNSVKLFYHLHVLIPPIPLLQVKEGGVKFFTPLCDAERGWGEFMRLYIW